MFELLLVVFGFIMGFGVRDAISRNRRRKYKFRGSNSAVKRRPFGARE